MKYIKGHTKNNISRWKNKRWYHQRFDGSPYLIHYIAEAEIRKETRKLDGDFDVHFCFFDNGKADWYIEMEDIKKVYTSVIQAGKKDLKISKKLMDAWKDDEDLFYLACEKVKSQQNTLNKLSNTEIIKLHDEFLEKGLNRHTSSSVIDGFALGTDQIVAEMIKKVYKNSNVNMRLSEVFSTLTAPIHLSFINQAEVELFKLAKQIKQKPESKDELLQDHQKKFFWIRNNYIDANILTTEYFDEEVNKILSSKIDIDEEINRIVNTPNVNKDQKIKLIKKLGLDEELKMMIEVSEDFTHWQDERKKATFLTAHYATLLLNEIGKRVGLASLELKYLSPREISNIFEKASKTSEKEFLEFYQEELKGRRNTGVLYWDKEGHEALSDSDEIKEAILGKTDLSDVDDFRGLSACTGKATGTVKVIQTSKEIDKVEKGDIMVAVMTRPDYVPAMRRAAAIVTNEGGVTCHAAIISRELGIPCIIGTKIATNVLQDGMRVEVNANHGWVRILK